MKQAFSGLIIITIMLVTLLFVFSCEVKAMTFENTFGGLTYHIMNPDNVGQLYSNKISSDGRLIFTGLVGLTFSENNDNFNMFLGQNSIGDLIAGWTYAYMWEWKAVKYGPTLGLYLQNDENFIKKGIRPFSFGCGLVLILGAEISIKVLTIDKKFVRLNTVITPVLVNETISLGVEL